MIVQVDQEIYDRLNHQLKDIPEKIPDTLKKTINHTAKKAEKNLRTEIRRQYVLKSASQRVKDSITTESATKKYPQATIVVRGGFIPLYHFQKRKNGKRVAAKAKVLANSSLKALKVRGGEDNGKDLKAFIATVKYGNEQGESGEHVGIFQRLTSAERGGRSKRQIKQLYGPPIPEMAGNKEVLSAVVDGIHNDLRESLDKHITKVMEGL